MTTDHISDEHRMNPVREALSEHIGGWVYNFTSTFSNIHSKMAGAVFSFFGFHITGFYGDQILITLLFRLMVIDLIVGVWDAIKNKGWKPSIFLVRGVIKFPMYVFYVFLVASLDHTAEQIFNMSLPILELFYLYLLSGEVYSIARHLKYIGFNVPEPVLWLAFGFKTKAQKKLKEFADKMPDQTPKNPPPTDKP